MTTKLQTYPKYKPSGIGWLGDIPGDWGIAKFRELFQVSNERVRDDSLVELPLSVSGYRGVEPRDIVSMEGQMPSEDVAEYRIVRKGQLAVNTMWLNYTGLGVSEYDGYVSPAYRSYNIKPRIDKRYAHHLLRSPLYVQKYTSLLYGVRPNSLQVKTYDFEHIEILLPRLETQKRIANFLDEKTKVIDELIERKEKLIKFLCEKRAALITRVVTKGLNPKAKMKSFGISWLGDIPEGWEVWKLKHLVKRPIKNGVGESAEYTEESWPRYIRITDIATPRSLKKDTFRSLPKDVAQKALVYPGDLLFAAVGATFGGSYLHLESKGEFCYAGYLVRFSPNERVYPSFVSYWTESEIYWNQMRANVIQATIQNFSAAKYKELLFLLPPLDIQEQIADFLDTETAKIDKATALIELQIKKLKEYRSSLIYHAVTGKIRV